jgi:glucans biosynthesis protein
MHGGAPGSGAPPRNRNALRSGLYTAESLEMRRHVTRLVRETRKIIEEM